MGTSLFICYLNFFATMNSRNNRSIDMKPNTSRNLTLCQYFRVNRSENTKSPNSELEIQSTFPSKIYPSEKVLYHNIHKKFIQIVAIATKKPATYTIKDEHEEVIRWKFHVKELIRVI